jgi:hypothetical protein
VIGRAQILYSVTKGRGKFTTLGILADEGLIDGQLASGEMGGYRFTSEPVLATQSMFDTTARPVTTGTFGTGNRSFGSNETMVLYEAEGDLDIRGTPANRVPAGALPME